jgi:hypothetical protein
MATHDLLTLNDESINDSDTYAEAFTNFLAEKSKWEQEGNEDIYDAEYGFELGFWAATRILTGFTSKVDRI